MFRTSREAEIPRPVFVGEDVHLWSCVEHGLHLPWFYARLVHYNAGMQISHMLMLSSLEILKSALNQRTPSASIEEIQLVSPGYFNKSGRWLMEPLLELIEVQAGPEQAISYIFKVMGDRLYTQGQPDEGVDQVRRTIYSAKIQSVRSPPRPAPPLKVNLSEAHDASKP
ncbi:MULTISPECIES: hypothetical protein [Pseudomonas]|uniref:Uncharacterized protein n=1 Tax=Pseudomonas helmanticensis TaxID=1471381 RepID=A0A4R7VJ61_9PSED|nr:MULTISPECIES: hypothetical protein [Pseudomonas]TDV49463.1 hypothetical protein EDF87_104109 [Pseudomonas helmanticensis]WGT36082.1 hypothetical protein QG303_11095 [Pseudomonas atacamensis]